MAGYFPHNREAMRLGRDAAIARRVKGAEPSNPYRKGTQAARYFERALVRAERALDKLASIGR